MANKTANEVAAEVIGESEQAAEALIAAAGYAWRVVAIDGIPQFVTSDIRPDRISLSVDNGIIVAARVR